MKQLINPACPDCGKPLDHDSHFCGFCGGELSFVPTGFPDDDDWKEKTLGLCPSCSMPIPLDRNYCIFCGKKLHDPEEQAAQIEMYREAFNKLHRSEKDRAEPNAVCHYCHEPLDNDAVFCGYCGAFGYQDDKFQPRYDKWHDEDLEVCPYCSQVIPAKRRYCILCGGPLHLLKKQVEAIKENRSRHVDCSITFNIAELAEHDIEMFYLYLHRNRTLSDQFIAEQNHTVECSFSISYDEPGEKLTMGIVARFVQLYFEDVAKEFPKVQADAYCDYDPTYIGKSRLSFFDDRGGFIHIELKDGEVTVDDTPFM